MSEANVYVEETLLQSPDLSQLYGTNMTLLERKNLVPTIIQKGGTRDFQQW